MRPFFTLCGKETMALFRSPIAYVVIAVFLVVIGYTFTGSLFLNQTADLIGVFAQAAVMMLLIVPVLTMRLFAEERRQGTLEVLLTSPVREIEVVLAKFLATMAVIVVMLAVTLAYPLVLEIYGSPDWGPVYSGYLGLLLLGSALVSMGLTISALTSNQIIAAVVSLGIFLLFWMLNTIGSVLPSPWDNVVRNTALQSHIVPFATGAMYLSDFGYFAVLILLGLLFSVRALARR